MEERVAAPIAGSGARRRAAVPRRTARAGLPRRRPPARRRPAARPLRIRRPGPGEGGLPRRPPASLARRARPRRASGLPQPRPRATLRRVSDAHPGSGHRHERDDVQRAQRGRAPAAAVCASERAGEGQHAPHAAEPMGWHVGGQLPRLAAAERHVRGDDVLPADERQRRSRLPASTRRSARRRAWSARSSSSCSALRRSSEELFRSRNSNARSR